MKRPLKVVDLFAGAGGASTGALMAGARVLWAGNHNPVAVQVHANNHVDAEHVCQDLQQADWAAVPAHDLLWASPCCQGHTKARGREQKWHDESRSTAWAVVSAAEYHLPPFLVVENVTEFLDWKLFPAWRQALELLGYTLTFNELNAADFGVPQARRRLFVVGTRTGALELDNPGLPHVAASTVVDWRVGFEPIGDDRFGVNTMARIARGREQHGDRFVAAYYGSEKGGRSVDKPFGTLTTRDRFLLVDGADARLLSVDEARRAMGFPDWYVLPRQKKLAINLLGNAVCPPVAQAIVEQIARVA